MDSYNPSYIGYFDDSYDNDSIIQPLDKRYYIDHQKTRTNTNIKGEKENIDKKEEKYEINNKIPKQKGRKPKYNNYKEDANSHNKFTKDNIMRKIKTFVFKYILNKLNASIKNKRYKFYRLNKCMNQNIKKDFNVKLLDRTLEDIYKNSDSKFKNKDQISLNSITIEKIFEEKKEIETIKILNLTYKDIIDIIREKDLKLFLKEIRKKEKKNENKRVEAYMKSVRNLLLEYEDWFYLKQERKLKCEKNH